MSGSNQRYLALDGLRGVAALLIVLYHVELPNHFTVNAFTRHGYLAVDLFFILSGFVISSAYSRRIVDARSAGEFYLLRFFRIYPLHIAMLLAFALVECVKFAAVRSGAITLGEQAPFSGNNTIGALVVNVFMLQGLGIFDALTWNSVSWSVSCEFVAYFMFSIVTWSGLVRRKGFFLVGATAGAASLVFIITSTGTLDVVSELAVARCLSGFIFGMLIFQLALGPWARRFDAQSNFVIGTSELAVILVLVGAMSLAPTPVQRGLSEAYPEMLLLIVGALILAVFVLRLDRGPISRILMSRPVQFLGKISYSIYMVHLFVWLLFSIILKRVFQLDLALATESMNLWVGDALVMLQVGLVIVTSAVTFAYIEEPGRRYGRRLLVKRAHRHAVRTTEARTAL
jgi:peptidoglycan/LPS O-acetylase OafA/YrhL